MLRSDIVIAVVGGIIWGSMNGWTYASIGRADAVLQGVIYGVVWAAAWLVVSYTREAYLRSKKTKL